MGKVVKAIAIGALIAVGAAFLLPAIGLASPFAGLFGLGPIAAAAVGGGIVGGLSTLLASSLDIGGATRGRLNISVDAQASGKWVFGQTAIATDAVFAAQHGGGKYVTHILAAAAHEIESFGDLYIKDELVSFSGDAATGDWQSALWRQTNLGTDTQSAFPDIDGSDDFAVTHWPTAAQGRGMAHYRIRWAIKHDKIASGIPTRITQIAKGAKVYDPRLDSTRGGSGAHRADDQTTWEYTNSGTDIGENWALICAFYLLGYYSNGKLIFGVGVDPDDIDWAQCISAANVCETVVDGISRYSVGGIMDTSNDHEDVVRRLEAMINGKIAQVGGKYYIWAPYDDLTIFSDITEADILREIGVDFDPSGPIEKLYNTARGRYVEPDGQYQAQIYPEVEESAAITEDGRVRLLPLDLPYLHEVSIAERVARHMVRRSRFGATWRFAMGPKGLTFRPFSVTTLNIRETNFVDTTVRVISQTFSPNGLVLMEVIEEDASIYDTASALGTPIITDIPTLVDPTFTIAVANLVSSPTAVQGSNGTASPAFQLTWDDPGTWTDRTEIQIKEASDTVWTIIAPARIDFLQTIITGIEPSTIYDIRARHINIHQVAGSWSQIASTSVSISVGSGLSEVPDFTPGHIGGSADFVYTLNALNGGSANPGEIRVQGDTFNHPDGTIIITDVQDFAIHTFYEGAVTGRFYIMYSATVGETRFGGIATDWGAGDDTRFVTVTWNLNDGWRARNNSGTFFAFTPLATDCIIAVVDKIAVTGGINSIILLTSGTSSKRFYIKPITGTAIRNGVGTLTVEAHKVESGIDTLLSAGTVQLYEGTTLITVANGYATGSDGYTGVLDAGDILGDAIIELKDGPSGAILDTITLVDIDDGLDGGDGADAVYGFIEPSNGLAWTRATNEGAWTPATLTSDFDVTFVQAGVEVARISRRVTLTSATGLLASSVTTHPGGNLNTGRVTVSVDGSASGAITISFAYSFGGESATVAETALSSQGGTDGNIGTPGRIVQLNYDDLDTTTLAAGTSRYAMLTARGTNTSGSQNNFHLTDAILINKRDISSADYSLFYSDMRIGDRIIYFISLTRWFLFEVDQLYGIAVGSGNAAAFKFGVTLVDSVDPSPTDNIPTAAGTDVAFQFSRVLDPTNPNFIIDPDFDLSTALTEDDFWFGEDLQVGTPGTRANRTLFLPTGGANGGGAVALRIGNYQPFSDGGAWITTNKRHRINTNTFGWHIKYKTNGAFDFSTSPVWVTAIGYDVASGGSSVSSSGEPFELPDTSGAWADLFIVSEAFPGVDVAQYWEFQVSVAQGGDGTGADVEVTIDSVFVYPAVAKFGSQINEGIIAAGSVPKANVTEDADKVLDSAGNWIGGAVTSEINTQNGNYTLILSDKGKTIRKATSTGSITHTIPANSSVAYTIGTLVAFRNSGSVNMTIAITTDTMTGTDGSTGSRTLGANQVAVVQKVSATAWEYAASDL